LVKEWLDERFKLKEGFFKPVPLSTLHFWDWLGALAFMSFLMQGVTGILIAFHYVPLPDKAYESVQLIKNYVPYGQLLLSLHRYGAYSMIFLAFIHMLRNFIIGSYRKPREITWIVGMLMGIIALSSGFTGYLLPWSVISKMATDVGLGILSEIPGINYIVSNVIYSSDAFLMQFFFITHVLLLPAVLTVLFMLKMWLFEVHGPYHTVESKKINWFPEAFSYFVMLSFYYMAFLLLLSSWLPADFPPKYTPEIASQYLPSPEWYFLWLYQIIKIEWIQKEGFYVFLIVLFILLLSLILLPFIVKPGYERSIGEYAGAIMFSELIVLSFWGNITLGQSINLLEAIIIILGTGFFAALIIRAIKSIKFNVKSFKVLSAKNKANLELFLSLLIIIFTILALILSSTFLMALDFLFSALIINIMKPWRDDK
jgi:quinol-cytochrome oxidoreductase complex cytochrome b subunit